MLVVGEEAVVASVFELSDVADFALSQLISKAAEEDDDDDDDGKPSVCSKVKVELRPGGWLDARLSLLLLLLLPGT